MKKDSDILAIMTSLLKMASSYYFLFVLFLRHKSSIHCPHHCLGFKNKYSTSRLEYSPFKAVMNNHDTLLPPPHRPSKLHKRSSSSPDHPPPPPPSPHRRRLVKRSSGSSQQHQAQQQQQQKKMDPGPLTIPPAPTSSDLSVDKELLQRWSARESPHGKSYQ
jgi:hypothetical protein